MSHILASTKITAHGVTYDSEKAVYIRIAELEDANLAWGKSDGRVTEQNALVEALDAAAAADYRRWARVQIDLATRELANLKAWNRRNVPADHRIEYEDGNRRLTSHYTTEDGFLNALVRLYSRPTQYTVIHVD